MGLKFIYTGDPFGAEKSQTNIALEQKINFILKCLFKCSTIKKTNTADIIHVFCNREELFVGVDAYDEAIVDMPQSVYIFNRKTGKGKLWSRTESETIIDSFRYLSAAVEARLEVSAGIRV